MRLRFTRKQEEVDGIWSFFFEPLEPLTWIAGQSIRLELPKNTWGVDERRFTIASAPHEKLIRITTRISDSNFKQSLTNLPEGAEVNGYNIEGNFVWGKSKKHRLLIAGGIGITPYRAMLAELAQTKQPAHATLLYSYNAKTVVFGSELDAWQAQDSSLQVVYLPHKRFTIDEHSSLPTYWLESLVYISGPTSMVQELATKLTSKGLPEKNLKLDIFTGAPL
jgi:ferredoxin-NADP reductase